MNTSQGRAAAVPLSSDAPSLGILDEHELMLDGLSSWFGEHAPDLRQTVRCTSWVELTRSPDFPPDVLLMDLATGDPVSVESRIRTCRGAGASVVVMGAIAEGDAERRVLDAGAAAFVPKGAPARELLKSVRRVLRARSAGVLAEWDGPGRLAAEPQDAGIRFTEDEEETLRLYASGHSPVEVAMILGTNIQAVKNALDRVREQYASEGRAADRKQDLVLRAAEDGYLA